MSTPPPPHHWPAPPPPYGYGPPALNGFALASLLVGLLCLPPLGIVFGIVALVQIAKKGERGKALALCGLAVSVAMTLAMVFVVEQAGGIFLDRVRALQPYEDVEGEYTDKAGLRPGDCFNVPGGDLLADEPFAYWVGCSQVHDAEVTSSTLLSGLRYPGADQLKQSVTEDCWRAQDAYAMDTWVLPPYAGMYYFAPTAASWADGDRQVVCVLGTSEQEHRGSLRKDGSMLNPEQVTFLLAVNEVDLVLGRSPGEDVRESLGQYRSWARDVDAALAKESRVLDGVKDRPQLAGPAGVQRERVEAARKQWQKAAGARDSQEFGAAWDRAVAEMPVGPEKVLRGAYGLSTTVPEWLEDADGDGADGSGEPSPGPTVEAA